MREIAALDAQAEIHRQLQTFIDRLQQHLGGWIIVKGFAATNGACSRPDRHALRRIDLAGRRTEPLLIPRLDGFDALAQNSFRTGKKVTFGYNRMNEIDRLRRVRLELVALHHHEKRIAGWGQARDALRAAGTGENADFDFRQSDTGFRIIGNKAMVTGKRKLERAAEADAVDRCNKRFAASFEFAEQKCQTPRFIEKRLHCGGFTAGGHLLMIGLQQALDHFDISPAGETIGLAGYDHAPLECCILGDMVNHVGEFSHGNIGDDVHGFARHIPCQGGDTVGIDIEVKLGEGGKCHGHTRSMIVAVPIPAPMQSVIRAVFLPVRSNSSSAVPTRIAPVAPSGWPSAMAPPFGLTRAGSTPKA